MDDDLGELPAFQMPANIDIPLKHDQPRTTLDSLIQIRNEFNTKLQEAKDKNDSSKKRRYERQLKQFEDAIKATKDGKSFNYGELVVPPGFAQIPLQNGQPILSSNRSSSSTTQQQQQQQPKIRAEPVEQQQDPNELSDELLEQLENELDDDCGGDDQDEMDPEDEKLKRQLNSIMPSINKLVPPPVKDPMMHNFEQQIESFKIPPAASKPSAQQQQSSVAKKSAPKNTTNNKELNIILERQRLFKEAALKAKQDGNINVALVYLRHAKGFESMITAAENGLPLDMSNLPVPPQLEKLQTQKSQAVSPSKVTTALASTSQTKILDETPLTGDRTTIFKRLQEDLIAQINISTANFKHFTSMGDVTNANRFNQIARESIQDLDALKNAFNHGEQVPLYHYEKRTYQTIDCNSDLTDNDLELVIIRAINLPLPKDFEAKHLNTYVKFEFPYPPEQSQTDKTNKQNATLNPEYNQSFRLQIQRKQTKFMRLMNRKELKLEIYYKAGLLKGDKLLGACSVKLQPLENCSTIHDAFDLLEGRKQCGGKLELKIRIREPLLHKEIKSLEHKWLIIDKFDTSNRIKSDPLVSQKIRHI